MPIQPVILSGGSGTRLWPLSRTALPKQFIRFGGRNSLFQQALGRACEASGDTTAPIVVSNAEQRFLAAEQIREQRIGRACIMLEPAARNTAPAVAAAALQAINASPDAVLLVMASDHLIDNHTAFAEAVQLGLPHAHDGAIVLFGIRPTRADTGFGYIRRGMPVAGGYKVQQFLEKPAANVAEQYVRAGDTYWNSGMFLLSAQTYLDQLGRFRPDILAAVQAAFDARSEDLDFIRLDAAAFSACPSDSIDYAVAERTEHAVVIEAGFGWSDVGNWQAFWETQTKDARGNAVFGDAMLEDADDNLVYAQSRMVAVLGMRDVAVVETPDAVFVAPMHRAQDVRKIVSRLEQDGRAEKDFHTRVYRPWGWYEGVDSGERFQVKRIAVNPGESLSLQMHHHRAEHWIVVQGTARVTCDERTFLLTENESTYIPLGSTHRLENPGKLPLHLVEVQSGAYLGEDDIVRFEDKYQR